MRTYFILLTAASLTAMPALAQSANEGFAGPHIGAAAGAVDHHFIVEETGPTGTHTYNVTQWGVGGEAFAGYDLALGKRFIVGGEAQFEFGGKRAVTQNSSYSFGIEPRTGFSLTARIGYAATPRLLVYAGGGYGEHHYTVIASGNVAAGATDGLDRTRSFVLRGGAEWTLAPRIGLRLEYEHLDGTRNQFMLGVPIRF